MSVVLIDPDAVAMIRAVGRVNCRRTFEAQADRVRYFAQRIDASGLSGYGMAIVLINVDDPVGHELAEVFMPGNDAAWAALRDQGLVPYARGLAGRDVVQGFVDIVDAEVGAKLCAMRGKVVVVVDYGAVDVFEAEAETEPKRQRHSAKRSSRQPPKAAAVEVVPIEEAIRRALVERGWAVDPDAVENESGELREFIHPETGKRMAWLDAVMYQSEREAKKGV